MTTLPLHTPGPAPDPIPTLGGRFAAIDFETADHGRDGACALGVVVVEGVEVVDRAHFLIRPPQPTFRFTYIHGISWRDVADQPRFPEVWPEASRMLEGAEFVAAHSAGFDRSVLFQCCVAAGLPRPELPFLCTARLAKQSWGLASAALPNVCRHLGIALRHHHAESDAIACATIVIEAHPEGASREHFPRLIRGQGATPWTCRSKIGKPAWAPYPASQRVELGQFPLSSVGPEDVEAMAERGVRPFDDSWLEEIQRRSAKFDAGLVQPIHWAEVKEQARRRVAQRR